MRQITFVLALCFLPSVGSLFGWLFGYKVEESYGNHGVIVPNIARFEMLSTDEKFISEFSNFLSEAHKQSELGLCFHKIIYKYTSMKKCSHLTEEELSKLAVHLLNCQSRSENRPVFECTDAMTIGKCTEAMDGSTWNAYHLMNNRARAMCYATQQEHFRRMTEMVVTRLALSAKSQLQAMDELQKGQETLHSLTTDTVRKLYESQLDLLGTHRELQNAHHDVMAHVTNNMDALMKEKALISTGNKELADMTENIRKKLDMTARTLTEQDSGQKENHKQIIEDLNNIHRKAQDALEKLDNSSRYFLKNHKEMMHHYGLLYENIEKINTTVQHLLSTVVVMQENLDSRIAWFSHVLGATEDKLTFLLCLGKHVAYFITMALLASFLQLPRLSRLAIILAITTSAVSELHFDHCLGFERVTAFCVAVIAGNCLYHIWRIKNPKVDTVPITRQSLTGGGTTTDTQGNLHDKSFSAQELHDLTDTLGRLYHSLNESLAGNNSHAVPVHVSAAATPDMAPRPDSSTMPEDLDYVRRYINELDDRRSTSSQHSRASVSTPIPSTSYRRRQTSRSSTPSSSTWSRCQGTTRSGTPCRLQSVSGQSFCHRHTSS